MKPEELRQQWIDEWKRANELFDQGKEAEAEKCLAKCARMSPEAWVGIGLELLESEDFKSALNRFKEALYFSKNPYTRAVCLNNIGTIMANNGYRRESLGYFFASIKESPSYADAFANIGLCYKWNDDLDPALEWTEKALKLNPLHAQAAFTKAMILLQQGKYVEGWEKYESRWRIKGANIRKLELPWPEWNGSNGDHVLIYGEQGAGDCIQMIRYAKLMKEAGIECLAAVQDNLLSLFATCDYLSRLFGVNVKMDGFDCVAPMMSLPRIVKQQLDNIPLAEGYIPLPAKSECLQLGPSPNIGICWSGSFAFKHNIWRSSQLIQWADVLEMPGITWHSFQVGTGEDEALLFPKIHVYPKPNDFLETARRMAGMDLIITVDTSVAHLAGALGIPVWILLARGPDFRWMVHRDDTPWYASAKLFRQQSEFDWKPVFQQVKNELHTRFFNHPLQQARPFNPVLAVN